MRPLVWPGDVPPDLRKIIERVCTEREIEVLKLKAAGYGRRRMALILGLSESAIRSRLTSADRKIRAEVAAMRGVA